MDGVESRSTEEQKSFLRSQICFILLAVVTSASAASIMMTNKQSAIVYGMNLDAKYDYSQAFKFFAIANIIACVCSIASLLTVSRLLRKGANPSNFFRMFLHDLHIMLLLGAACVAATTFGYVGKYGNSHIGWVGICDHFHKFCERATISVALSYLCFVVYFFLTIIAAYKSRNIEG